MLDIRQDASRYLAEDETALAAHRADAVDYVAQIGLPNKRVEAWHYTDFSRLLSQKNITALPSGLEASALSPYQIVYDASGISIAPELLADPAITIVDLLDQEPAQWVPAYRADATMGVASAHNLALLDKGLLVTVTGRPAHPLYISYRTDAATALRQAIRVEAHATLVLVEHYGAQDVVSSAVDVTLQAHAQVEHIIVHEAGALVTLNQAQLDAGSRLRRHYVTCAPSMARHESYISLEGEEGHADVTATMMLDQSAHCDITTVIDHKSGQSYSDTQIRTVLSDQAHGIFQGKILVRPDSQHIEADQSAKTLLLSDHAEMSVKPELEIFADDVACSHGATMGQVDQAALFFLRARGVPEAVARELLISAFLDSGLVRIQDETTRSWLSDFIGKYSARLAHHSHSDPHPLSNPLSGEKMA